MQGINRNELPASPELFITDLPVSVEGGVVKRGVSSAVHTIHIGASPDTVTKKKGLLNRNVTQQTNAAEPSVKSPTLGVTECVLITISVQQPSPTCTQVGVRWGCRHAVCLSKNEAVAASDQNRKTFFLKIRKENTQHQH